MYRIVFSKTAERQFNKLNKELQTRIINVLERIKIRPYSYVKKLVGADSYSLRVGDYRIILDIYESDLVILVIKLGHRKKIYKEL